MRSLQMHSPDRERLSVGRLIEEVVVPTASYGEPADRVGAMWDDHAQRLRNAQFAREIGASQQLSGSSTVNEANWWRAAPVRAGSPVRRDHVDRLVVDWQRPDDDCFADDDDDEDE